MRALYVHFVVTGTLKTLNHKHVMLCWMHLWTSCVTTGNDVFVTVFEAVHFTQQKLLVERGVSDRFAINKKAFKTLDRLWISGKHLKFERRRTRTSSRHEYSVVRRTLRRVNVGKHVELIEARQHVEQHVDQQQRSAVRACQAPSVDMRQNQQQNDGGQQRQRRIRQTYKHTDQLHARPSLAWRAWAHQVQTVYDDAPMPGRHCSTVSGGTLVTSLW